MYKNYIFLFPKQNCNGDFACDLEAFNDHHFDQCHFDEPHFYTSQREAKDSSNHARHFYGSEQIADFLNHSGHFYGSDQKVKNFAGYTGHSKEKTMFSRCSDQKVSSFACNQKENNFACNQKENNFVCNQKENNFVCDQRGSSFARQSVQLYGSDSKLINGSFSDRNFASGYNGCGKSGKIQKIYIFCHSF